MCYQSCIKYECPNCGEEPTPDRRTEVLCPPSSRCPLLYSRLLPRRVTFQPGPLCQRCRQAQERQRANTRNANQGRHPQFPGEQRRNGQGPAREPSLDRYQSFGRYRPDNSARHNQDRERQQLAQDPFTFEDRGDDYDNYHRYHAAQPRGYPPQQMAGPQPPRPPPPARSAFERQYRGTPHRPPVTPEPSRGHLDRNSYDDDFASIFLGGGYEDRDDEYLVDAFGYMRLR
jgi:hypothetical protein